MSRKTYQAAMRRYVTQEDFEELIFLAFRIADKTQLVLLSHAFPLLFQEFKERLGDPNGEGLTRGEAQQFLLRNPDDITIREWAAKYDLILP